MPKKRATNHPGLDFGAIDTDSGWRPPSLVPLSHIDTLALDTETDGIRWWDDSRPIGLSIYHPSIGAKYYPWGHASGNMDRSRVIEWCRRELRNKHIVGLNIKFDYCMLRNIGIDLEQQGCTLQDIAHSAALLDSQLRSFSLDHLAKTFINESKVGKDLAVAHMSEYTAGMVAPRAEADVRQTWKIYEILQARIIQYNLTKVQLLENSVIYPTAEMERNGVRIDNDKLDLWTKQVQSEIIKEQLTIHNQTGVMVKPRSIKSLNELCFRLGLRTRKSFTSAILKEKDLHPLLLKAMKMRELENLLSKFLIPFRERQSPDGYLRSTFHQLRNDTGGTITGRYSSAAMIHGKEGINSQQVKKRGDERWPVRELIVPGNGQFFSADAEQIEYRLFAGMSQNKTIIGRYKNDPWYNFHRMAMEEMQKYVPNITYNQAKILNFSIIYGASAPSIGVQLGLYDESEKYDIDMDDLSDSRVETLDTILKTYNRFCPEAKQLLQQASKKAVYKRRVNTIAGRAAWYPKDKHGNYVRRPSTALNSVIQGSAADIQKQKTVELYRNRKQLEIVLRITVHDEVGGDLLNPDKGEQVKELLNTQSFKTSVPILWGFSSADNWASC